MTFAARYTPITYQGNGVTTRFPTVWPFHVGEDVRVEEIDADGNATPLVFGEDYTVEGGGIIKGTVVAATAPAEDVQWRITRRTPLLLGYEELEAPPPPPPEVGGTFIAVGDGNLFDGFQAVIMRSVDAGETWDDVSPSSPAITRALYWCDTDNEGNWLIGGNQKILRSTDDGLTWEEVTPPETGRRWDYVCHIGGGTFIAQTSTGGPPDYIYRTADLGDNWTDITPLGGDEFMNAAANGMGTIVVPHGAGSADYFNAWVSTDYGDSWVEINEQNDYADGQFISYVNGNFVSGLTGPGIVYSSTGLAASWTFVEYSTLFTAQTGEFAWDGTYYWGSSNSDSKQMQTSSLASLPTQPAVLDSISFRGIASDGAGNTVFVDYNDQEDAEFPGVYRSTGSLILTPVMGPAFHNGATYRHVAYGSTA